MKNEAGFILPTTTVVIFVCLLIFSAVGTAYITEKKFFEETEQYYILDNMMTLAVVESLKVLDTGNIADNVTVSEHVEGGGYAYKFIKLSPTIYEVQVTCSTTKGREYKAKYQYDLQQKQINLWSE